MQGIILQNLNFQGFIFETLINFGNCELDEKQVIITRIMKSQMYDIVLPNMAMTFTQIWSLNSLKLPRKNPWIILECCHNGSESSNFDGLYAKLAELKNFSFCYIRRAYTLFKISCTCTLTLNCANSYRIIFARRSWKDIFAI